MEPLIHDQPFELAANQGLASYNIQISNMGAAGSIEVQLSNDGTTFTTDRVVTQTGHVALRDVAADSVKLVGVGGTDFTATIRFGSI